MGSDSSVYSSASRSAVRDRVDATAMVHGFAFPDWYLAMKAERDPAAWQRARHGTHRRRGRLDGPRRR